MASLLDAPNERLIDMLVNGRGNGSGFSTYCQNVLSIPANTFRLVKNSAPLYDPTLKPAEIDRAISIEWSSANDGWDIENNILDVRQLQGYIIEVYNGVALGLATSNQVKVDGSEVATDVVLPQSASVRAHSDAHRIKRALTCAEMYEGGTDPLIKWIKRQSDTTKHSSSGNGKLILVTTYQVTIEFTATTRYAP